MPKPEYHGTLTPAEAREAFKPVQFEVGSGYVVSNYRKGTQQVFASSIRGGAPQQLSGITDTAKLVIDAGRLAAYDGNRVRVFDLATGGLVTQQAADRRREVDPGTGCACDREGHQTGRQGQDRRGGRSGVS